jgi:N-acetyl-anhydromuramyl-L-alanine amidase AmpD
VKVSNVILIGGHPHYVGREVRVWSESGLSFEALGKRTETRAVVVHHTGGEGDAAQVHRVLKGRGLSVQFFIDHLGIIHQYCDASARASHAGTANGWSCGIEIQNRANANPVQRGIKREVVIERIHGKEGKRTTMLPEQVASAIALVEVLCKAYGLPMEVPLTGADVTATVVPNLSMWRGVLGHLHLKATKIDPGLVVLRAIAAHRIRDSWGGMA